FQAEDGIRDFHVTGVQTCALPILGQEARKYHIDIWYKKGENDFYRVDLANEEDDNRQTILKNDEGVFVLTPVLNKSFKFQSDWRSEERRVGKECRIGWWWRRDKHR